VLLSFFSVDAGVVAEASTKKGFPRFGASSPPLPPPSREDMPPSGDDEDVVKGGEEEEDEEDMRRRHKAEVRVSKCHSEGRMVIDRARTVGDGDLRL